MNKKLILYVLIAIILTIGIIQIINQSIRGVKLAANFIDNPLGITLDVAEIDVTKKKEYLYNERIPEEEILQEMNILAKRFHLDSAKWERLLRCESTNPKDGKIDNLICNPVSTACGLGQYLIRTWYETESWKQFRKTRTDYKAMLWEMGLDLRAGELDKWIDCTKKEGIKNINL